MHIPLVSDRSLISKIEVDIRSNDIGSAMGSKNMNDMFVKNFDFHNRYKEEFYRRRISASPIKHLERERIAAIEIYMLCPHHDFLLQGLDVNRLFNWISAL